MPPVIPFDFFSSLVQEIANASRKCSSSVKNSDRASYPQLQCLKRWITALHKHYSPLPPGFTLIFFRFFFPEEDVSRRYGMQETKLAQQLANVLSISTSSDARGHALRKWTGEDTLGCLGNEVETIWGASCTVTESGHSMSQVDALLNELAATSAFSSIDVRSSFLTGRPKIAILKQLYSTLTPFSAALVTQIILQDLRPLLYPLTTTHYSTSLLQHNTRDVKMITKEDAMRAWDPSGRMLRAYRLRATFEAAAETYDNPALELSPEIGVPVSIPKCQKGQGCAHSLKLLSKAKKVWAETKYDGERTQIHVEIVDERTYQSRITIFSKSKRDSTLDRFAVHAVVRDALGLPHPKEGSSEDKWSPVSSDYAPRLKKNIILEAEMVAFSDTLSRVDEFWRIRSLIASTARGVRHRSPPPMETQNEGNSFSQESMISNASDQSTRHLALVFFDVLMLDSVSLIDDTYAYRRAVLESIVVTRYGWSMLAKRWPVQISGVPQEKAVGVLERIFAKLIADCEEGAVLKADEARYNDWRLPWVKLKRDYIPGHGDAVDLALLGASWDKERGRELRASPSVYTTFYLGVLANPDALISDPPLRPHFKILFTCSYGLNREALEDLNFRIRHSESIKYEIKTTKMKGLPYTFDMNPGIPAPEILLCKPLLGEVFGAGYTKAPRSKYYELRFPRLIKVYRISERNPLTPGQGTTLEEYQRIARYSVGKDRPGKDVDDWCKHAWSEAAVLSPISPSVRSAEKRKVREEEWLLKLRVVDEVALRQANKRRKTVTISNQQLPETVSHSSSVVTPQKLVVASLPSTKEGSVAPMGSISAERVAHIASNPTTTANSRAGKASTRATSKLRFDITSSDNEDSAMDDSNDEAVVLPTPPVSSPIATQQDSMLVLPDLPEAYRSLSRIPTSIASDMDDDAKVAVISAIDITKTTDPDDMDDNAKAAVISAVHLARSIIPDPRPYEQTPLAQFLKDAFVWMARPADARRPSWRVPSHEVIPHGQQVNALDALLIGCGWVPNPPQGSSHIKYGVIFIDYNAEQEVEKSRLSMLVTILLEKRLDLVERRLTGQMKRIYILSTNMLSYDELEEAVDGEVAIGEIEQRALFVLG
ncbi:hypothetical protein K474DRAFT_1704941 [Panus rudis PR-1116 ss-1]|nr:hypothetical protein K474DRAFT_1704941 [Panus rudis PR-1116 ss-1]